MKKKTAMRMTGPNQPVCEHLVEPRTDAAAGRRVLAETTLWRFCAPVGCGGRPRPVAAPQSRSLKRPWLAKAERLGGQPVRAVVRGDQKLQSRDAHVRQGGGQGCEVHPLTANPWRLEREQKPCCRAPTRGQQALQFGHSVAFQRMDGKHGAAERFFQSVPWTNWSGPSH